VTTSESLVLYFFFLVFFCWIFFRQGPPLVAQKFCEIVGDASRGPLRLPEPGPGAR
jgi:hypothetical protein